MYIANAYFHSGNFMLSLVLPILPSLILFYSEWIDDLIGISEWMKWILLIGGIVLNFWLFITPNTNRASNDIWTFIFCSTNVATCYLAFRYPTYKFWQNNCRYVS